MTAKIYRVARALRVAILVDDPRSQKEIAAAANMSEAKCSKLINAGQAVCWGDPYVVDLARAVHVPVDAAFEEIVPAAGDVPPPLSGLRPRVVVRRTAPGASRRAP